MTDDFTSGFRAGIEKAAEAVASAAWKHEGDDTYSQGMDSGARHQLKTCLDAVRALLPEGAEGWRSDMENAPRDRAILVWRKSQLMVARWDDDHYANKPRPFWNCLSVWGKRDERDEPPTHWRPMLPSPPTGKGE